MQSSVFEKIKKSKNLPQVPLVMLKLAKLCNNTSTSIQDLTETILTDPSLSSRLLQTIESPYINLPKEVNSIETAVVHLGIDAMRNMAISTSAMQFFSFFKTPENFDMAKFWYHSYKCGIIAEQIAHEINYAKPDEFFLAGLLHDVGRLVLMQNFPDEYESIFAVDQKEEKTLSKEREMFDADTSHISAWLFSQWDLNPLISDAVFYINEPSEHIEGALSHVKILFSANLLAGNETGDSLSCVPSLTGLSFELLDEIAEHAEEQVSEITQSLGINDDNKEANDDALAAQVKGLPVFFGTLQNLLQSRDIDTIFEVVQNGFKIIFNIERIFYFILDDNKGVLTGFCSENDKAHKTVKTVSLPMSNKSSILVQSVQERSVQNSFGTSEKTVQAISDTQIIKLLETTGMYCVPIYSTDRAFGVMALGVDKTVAADLDANAGLVSLFSRQAGVCMHGMYSQFGLMENINEKSGRAYTSIIDQVIHEINNPVSIVKNYLESLSLKLPDKHPVQNELSVIGEEINRIAGLLGKLTNFSKIKTEGFQPVDINMLCKRILGVLKKTLLLPKQIKSSITTDPALPMIKTDKDGFKQVFINLVKNAAEAVNKGGTINITTRFIPDVRGVNGEAKSDPPKVEIIIADDGPGIDEDIKKTLFEPYTTTKADSGDHGLGLSIVHSIIKELSGDIVFESTPDKGTCFVVTLPVELSGNYLE